MPLDFQFYISHAFLLTSHQNVDDSS